MIVKPEKHWKEWNRSDWNAALFYHYFFDVDGTSVPVRTLSVTPESLFFLTGDQDAVPEDVKEFFLKAVGNDPKTIRHHLSPYRYVRDLAWLTEEPPHFFLYLILTCFVASASDATVSCVGNFRNRLRILLGNDETVTYSLEGLNGTWQLLKIWLDHNRSKGAPYLDLALPDPGHMTWIGHSIRLAFPNRKDLNKLIEVLADAELGDDPAPLDIIKLVSKKASLFSQSFCEKFEEFRAAYFSKSPDIGKSLFWAAVKQALSVDRKRPKENRPKFGLILFPSDSGFEDDMYLLTDKEFSFECTGKPVRFVRAESNTSSLTYIAIPGTIDGEDPVDIIGALLSRALFRSVPELKKSNLSSYVSQGMLLFVKNEVGMFESSIKAVRDGSVKVFVRNELKEQFLAAFTHGNRPAMHKEYRYAGWVESEPFDAEDLLSMEFAPESILQGIRCLQPPIEKPGLHISGGIRVEDGYLGIPPCLPMVHAQDAEQVEMMKADHVDPRKGGPCHFLTKAEDGAGVFSIDLPPSSFLEGQYRIIARDGDKTIGVKGIEFKSKAAPHDYKYPTTPSNWYVEGIGPEIQIYTPDARGWYLGSDAPDPEAVRYEHNIHNLQHLPDLPIHQSDAVYSAEAGSLIEICAGKSARKGGMSEGEFIELLLRIFPLRKKYHIWDVARSWTENCYFDRLIDRTWKNCCYYPVPPHLVVRRIGSKSRAVLAGLATREIRQFVSNSMALGGALREERFSHSQLVPAPLAWCADGDAIFSHIAEEIKIPLIESHDVTDHLWPIGGIIAKTSRPPTHYSTKGLWDWEKGFFLTQDADCDKNHHVQVEWKTRAWNDAPDYYVISRNCEEAWWTYSRNWALLVAYTLAGQIPFLASGGTGLLSIGMPRIYLPLVYARSLSVTSHIVPSPLFGESVQSDYVYTFPIRSERERFLGSLWNRSIQDKEVLARSCRNLLSEAKRIRRSEERTMPLPRDLRERLKSLKSNPWAKELAQSRFPARMILGIIGTLTDLGFRGGRND